MQKLDTDEIGLEGEKQVDLDDVGINAFILSSVFFCE